MRCCPLGQSCQLLPLEDQKLRQPRVFISTQKPDSVKDLSIQGNQHREPCHCGLRFCSGKVGGGGNARSTFDFGLHARILYSTGSQYKQIISTLSTDSPPLAASLFNC